jgi:hypothetical protein
MLDTTVGERIIKTVGGEDRALLRSNPSARTDAGMAAEGYYVNRLPPPVRSNDPGHKALNLGVWGGAPIQRKTFPRLCRCHLARSTGASFETGFPNGFAPWAICFRPAGASKLACRTPHTRLPIYVCRSRLASVQSGRSS